LSHLIEVNDVVLRHVVQRDSESAVQFLQLLVYVPDVYLLQSTVDY
jgi:hypothetical protein